MCIHIDEFMLRYDCAHEIPSASLQTISQILTHSLRFRFHCVEKKTMNRKIQNLINSNCATCGNQVTYGNRTARKTSLVL